MLRKRILRNLGLQLSLALLILNVLDAYSLYSELEIGKVNADSFNSIEWLYGDWQYRKSHVINAASGAGTNYQVRIKAFYSEPQVEKIVPYAQLVSTLPIPSGTTIISAQAAVYWDGTYLYVWYGASTGGPSGDDIYYTKTSDFVNWATPVKVIDRTDGIRDPTVFVEGNYIYLFCQCHDGSNHRPIRLYKIAKTADFTNSANYVYVGAPIDVGSSGQFDDAWVASPCVVKIGSTYWMAYEAKKSDGTFSIGRAYTTNIEGSWTKDGQMRDSNGNVIYNPYGQTVEAIVPCTFPDTDTLFVHIGDGSGGWYVRYMNGDIPNNNMTLSSTNCQPGDGYSKHAAFAHVGFINGIYMFLMQSWDTTAYLRLYKQSADEVYLSQHCRTDFGDVRFTRSDGSTLLDYWMEEKVDGDYAIFWVKVADDLSTNPATIYIYYGNPDATTTSNGENTFLFFDDFPGTSYNPDKWQVIGSPTITVSNGELKLQRNSFSGSWSVHGLRSKTFQADEKRVIARAKTSVFSSACNVEIHESYYSKGQANRAMFEYWTNNRIFIQCDRRDVGGSYTETILASNVPVNTYYTFYLTRWGSSYLKGWLNGDYKGRVTSYVNDGSTYIGLFIDEWASHGTIIGTYDYIAVAKYVDPEPSHGEWGKQEHAGAPPTPSISVSDINVNTTIAAKPCNFSAVFTAQNSNLSHYIFGTNNTGTWINDTAVSFGEGKTQASASIIKTLNSTIGTVIQWQIWANNTAGNWTTTGIQTLTTSGNQSTIATLTTYGYAAVEYACQRKTFYANGRFWVFYYDGASSAGYSTSTDGFSWTPFTPFTSRTCGAGWRFAVAYDGTRLHYVFSTGTNGDPLYYRCGLPNADGTITWLDNEQNITIGESDTGHLWPSIAIDSEGRPWVAYARKNATENSRYAYVTTSITSNGTWITRVGFPHRLSSTNYTGINVMIVPLTNQKMLAIISCGGWQIESYLWNGSSWSEKQTTTSAITSDGIIECGLSAVNQGDDVHLVFIKDSTHDLVYTKYSYASNSWGPETIVQPTVNSETSPVLSIDSATNMLYCFWAGAPTADCIYYKVYNGAAWSFVEGSNPWIIERNLAGYYRYDGLSGFYKSYNNLLGLAYTNGAYGIYQLKFAFLTTKARQYVIIDQALVSDERANVGSVQTVMFHAKWSNGSDVVHGSIYINGTEYITDNMGWITFEVTLTQIGKDEWGVTAVSCSGVTDYMQLAPNPSIIWDKIIITYSANPANPTVGQTVNFTISAVYGYNGEGVNFSYINTYRNNTHYASGNSFTDIQYSEVAYLYTVENVSDNLYGLTAFTSNTITVQWVSPPPKEYVIIDAASVSDNRADVSSLQTVAFHAKWGINGSDIVNGNIYVNGTMFTTNSTGWVSLNVASSSIGRQEWVVTAVNCEGVTDYTQIVSNPSIIWDQIQITSGGTTKESIMLGETATIWFQAKYQYDDTIFDNTNGILYVNDLPMSWSATNSRWEYQYTPTTPGTKTFTISSIQDNSYGLTTLNDMAGAQTIIVWSTPFLIISNSNITELAFNSTTKTITFTVTGPTGTIGYTNITIAKTLIENIRDLTIYLDGNQIEYTATSTEYAWLIHFTYTHSTHKVTIQLSQPNVIKSSSPQQETTTLLGGILIGILTATPLIHKKVRRKTR